MSESADHIIAREFFLPKQRGKIPKAPACRKCNSEKSKLEHYLLTVLPFGGRHKDAKINLVNAVPKRLGRNVKLFRELSSHRQEVWNAQENGLILKTSSIPIDDNKLLQFLEFVVKGLLWYHWRLCLKEEHFIKATSLTTAGEKYLQQNFLDIDSGERISKNWGEGTFCYDAVQDQNHHERTAWSILIYGGIRFTDRIQHISDISSRFGVITGNKCDVNSEGIHNSNYVLKHLLWK